MPSAQSTQLPRLLLIAGFGLLRCVGDGPSFPSEQGGSSEAGGREAGGSSSGERGGRDTARGGSATSAGSHATGGIDDIPSRAGSDGTSNTSGVDQGGEPGSRGDAAAGSDPVAGGGSGGRELDAGLAGAGSGGRENTNSAGAPAGNGQAGAGAGAGVVSDPCEERAPNLEHLALWLRSDCGLITSGDRVTRWDDQVGDDDAFQMNSESQPARVYDSKTGKPVVQFDGKDDFLELKPKELDYSGGFSIFYVAEFNGSQDTFGNEPPCPHILSFGRAGAADATISVLQDNNLVGYSPAIYVGQDYAACPLLFLDQEGTQSYSATQVGTQAVLASGGSECTTVANPSEFPTPGSEHEPPTVRPAAPGLRDQRWIGTSASAECKPLFGKLGEILVFDRPLEPAQRAAVEAYLKRKWRQ